MEFPYIFWPKNLATFLVFVLALLFCQKRRYPACTPYLLIGKGWHRTLSNFFCFSLHPFFFFIFNYFFQFTFIYFSFKKKSVKRRLPNFIFCEAGSLLSTFILIKEDVALKINVGFTLELNYISLIRFK